MSRSIPSPRCQGCLSTQRNWKTLAKRVVSKWKYAETCRSTACWKLLKRMRIECSLFMPTASLTTFPLCLAYMSMRKSYYYLKRIVDFKQYWGKTWHLLTSVQRICLLFCQILGGARRKTKSVFHICEWQFQCLPPAARGVSRCKEAKSDGQRQWIHRQSTERPAGRRHAGSY